MSVKKLRPNVFLCDSVLVQHYLTLMKDARCPNAQFRQLAADTTRILMYEALDALTIPAHLVRAHDCRDIEYEGLFLDTSDFVLIGVIRSGMAMAAAAHSILPDAQMGSLGFDANRTEPLFFEAAPDLDGKQAFIFDPAISTGRTTSNVAKRLVQRYRGDYSKIAVITLTLKSDALTEFEGELGQVPIFTAGFRTEAEAAGLGDVRTRLFGNNYRIGD